MIRNLGQAEFVKQAHDGRTNQRTEGSMVATVAGRFMGSGDTQGVAHFRPELDGPDFDLKVAIEATDLTTMNDMLRAYGKFDVVAGSFSFYSELAMKHGRIASTGRAVVHQRSRRGSENSESVGWDLSRHHVRNRRRPRAACVAATTRVHRASRLPSS
jgi:hypothetical protein